MSEEEILMLLDYDPESIFEEWGPEHFALLTDDIVQILTVDQVEAIQARQQADEEVYSALRKINHSLAERLMSIFMKEVLV
eukprot:CAMPEP_0171490876 /NCGR_PEP_ID=MMETSP0958-20121227/3552_1 /TAXON_ID=87120 /ORGANISM="Aurantiochytrium limacinum, Strain ATCCMYA-1381" /LENGTH=80 /DNA_ID=CAMNT_0012024241 /DNA_START=159 /DNA_END=401 /DNA_ORIENTATION=-